MKRRTVFSGGVALGMLATPAGRLAAGEPAAPQAPRPSLARVVPFCARADQITAIKVCLRPFRACGPRLDVEHVAGKTVIHNYGHGGSGWSLSWGSADIAVGKAAATLERRLAVIGCGIIGLTAALTAQRAGFEVTIYTRDLLPHTRSVRANGKWTPDSRIALTQQAGPGFGDVWERMARHSWAAYRDYLGLPGNPITFIDEYALFDEQAEMSTHDVLDPARPTFATTGAPQQSAEFAHYGDRIRDIIPAAMPLSGEAVPFGVPQARYSRRMMYNFGAFGHLLLSEFHQAGGRIVVREFHRPADLASLPEKVVINCPGYAARDWWDDKSVIAVRGQTAWLPPDPRLNYSLYYRGAEVVTKSDGVMVQNAGLEKLGEMAGVGNGFEHPDRGETEQVLAVFAELFSRPPARQG